MIRLLSLLIVLVCWSFAGAQVAETPPAADPGVVRRLVQNLVSDSQRVRDASAAKLRELGWEAVSAHKNDTPATIQLQRPQRLFKLQFERPGGGGIIQEPTELANIIARTCCGCRRRCACACG